ncbi:MAG: Asp-tRNA(Asn)/Glu-tRNA(Gln) amidotransferase subunit GatB [Tatlockia sp.]|jgi:aspartyl-tRNA(Asn)/glutamyl-tRNA(Gln) amidotransferase subunit B
MAWDLVIGLEVHVQLHTQSKLFSGASTAFGAAPNTQTCFIDAGLPGVLPCLNARAVEMAIAFGLAIDATINSHSYFERKNYFYPDLPKGYQISQFQRPIVEKGHLTIALKDGQKSVDIVRAHLEEDAGKSLHEAHPECTGIDLNRAGNPLLEIVTAPCLTSSEEALAYLKTLHRLVRFLGISDGNMQEGSFRCDVNLSLKPKGETRLGVRTELKNLNSFRFIQKAIAYEQQRQQDVLESGSAIRQETRLYCPLTNKTELLRSKENENDYRYFPDPDLLPIEIAPQTIESVRQTLPPLPGAILEQLRQNEKLTEEDIEFVLTSPATFAYFNALKNSCHTDEKTLINWLKGPVAAALNEANSTFEKIPLSPSALAPLLNALNDKKITTNQARQIFAKLWAGLGSVEELILKEAIEETSEDALENKIATLLNQYPEQVADYRAGKEKLLAFFVGQLMKQMKGKANPEQLTGLLKKQLQE